MANVIPKGDRVFVSATYFDAPNSNNAWSRHNFGSSFNSTKCYGTVIKASCSSATVLWDVDQNTTRCLWKDLTRSEEHAAAMSPAPAAMGPPSSASLKRIAANDPDGAKRNKKKPTFQRSVRNEIPSSSSSSEDSSSEDEQLPGGSNDNELLEVDEVAINENIIIANDTEWEFFKEVHVDKFKDHKYRPQFHLPTNRDLPSLNEMEVWLLFFPINDINHILTCSNAHLRDRRRVISKHEFFKVIGILYAMSTNVLSVRRKYWSNTSNGLFPAPAFGTRFGMGLHRFEEILMAMSFAMPEEKENGDKWYQVRPLIKMTLQHWKQHFCPGYKITVDESMFAWYGKGNFHEKGMPAVMKIKRKPKGVGCEVKTACDSTSRIMISMEINEGKENMKDKKWQKEFGAGTATTLRLTEPWHGTGRIVVGDSWFGSVKTAVELQKRGMFFLGMVKTAYRNYPLKQAVLKCPVNKGAFVSATARSENIDLISVGWRDRKVHTFVGTCGTTLDGEPCKKRRIDEQGQIYHKEVARPKLVEDYFSGAPAIDIHNHIRQDGLVLESVWQTQQWHHRMFACIFGIMETNAFLSYNLQRSENDKKPHSEFTATLALQLINNNFGPPSTPRSDDASIDKEPSDIVMTHVLVPLSKDDERKRVQRKCVICSRVHHKQQKASFFCKKCGSDAVLCSPQTGRDCYEYHIKYGIPLARGRQ